MTIAHSAKARIFEDIRNGNDYACLYGNGHPRLLSTSEHFEYELVHFAGPYVAYVQNIEAVDDDVGVTNMSTGHTSIFQELVRPIEHAVCAKAESLVLKPDGAVAWIATNFLAEGCEHPPTGVVEVRAHDKHGLRTIEASATIAPKSLCLTGSTLRWMNGALARTATLY